MVMKYKINSGVTDDKRTESILEILQIDGIQCQVKI